MQEFLSVVLYPSLFAFLGIAGTKFWEWVKPKFQTKIDNADAKAKEIDNEIKSAEFYRSLLDDASNRIKEFVVIIENLNNKVEDRDKRIEQRDSENIELKRHIAQLLISNETLIKELQKFKQLNGKG